MVGAISVLEREQRFCAPTLRWRRIQAGGFLFGILLGILAGISAGLLTAIAVSKIGTPFVEKSLFANEKRIHGDPNTPLHGRKVPLKVGATAGREVSAQIPQMIVALDLNDEEDDEAQAYDYFVQMGGGW